MAIESNSYPRLDLAPKLDRPLRLWWPLDYLRLLYWAFFFPQAIRWYIKEFGNPECRFSTAVRGWFWLTLRDDRIQRSLIIQSALLVTACGWGIQESLTLLGFTTGSPQAFTGAAIGAALGFFVGLQAVIQSRDHANLSYSIGDIVVFGIVFGASLGLIFGGQLWFPADIAPLVMLIIFVPLVIIGAFVVSLLLIVDPTRNFIDGIITKISICIVFASVMGVGMGVLIGILKGTLAGLVSTVIISSLFMISGFRLIDWGISWLIVLLSKGRYWVGHMAWLPTPIVKSLLRRSLEEDWRIGIENSREIINYTAQFLSVVEAFDSALSHVPEDQLLRRVVEFGNLIPDWDLFKFISVDTKQYIRSNIFNVLRSLLPQSSKEQDISEQLTFQLDAPARAACAGFWCWHMGDAEQAAEAFAHLDHLPHGEELSRVSRAIVTASQVEDLETMTAWAEEAALIELLPNPKLRPGTSEVLLRLRAIGDAMKVARSALSPLNRSLAIGRARARLDRLIATGDEFCGQPEWHLILKIAYRWQDIIIQAGGVLSDDILRRPVDNPYKGYSGLPVTGTGFVGREDILREIETRWVTGGRLPPLIIYGHRRMGKSSILRNLGNHADPDTIFVYMDMQDAGWVDHTGQLLLDFAEAIHDKVREANLNAGPEPNPNGYVDLGIARRSLNTLLKRLNDQMSDRRLILAVDEYEFIETGIQDGRIDADVPSYLRSKTSEYPWLALIFGGLHTLDEMNQDYRSAFWGAAEHIRVGYMSHEDTIRLITKPHPDFALEYAPELQEKLFLLTHGQPYLLQRICWELVNRWNMQFLKDGAETSRVLVQEDLASVLTPDFFQAAGYYFEGVWRNITEPERRLLLIMAQSRDQVWQITDLTIPAKQPESEIRNTLMLLDKHDLIVSEAGSVRFAAELMHHWVANYGGAI